MADARLDWRLLQAFVWLSKCGSFRSAAFESHISLNTLRSQIERLEHTLGRELVVRTVAGVAPTEDGERVLAVIAAMRLALEAATGDTDQG